MIVDAGGVRVGVDIGGTFTDIMVFDAGSGRFHIGKTLTTPDDPSRAVTEGLSETLRDAGIDAEGAIRAGEVEATLGAYKEEKGIDLLVMGAYGHSRIRHLLVGSTTTGMLRKASVPVLLLR